MPFPCQSCASATINGIPCHETGCPDAWRDKPWDCVQCGCEFFREFRHANTCSDCIAQPMADAMPERLRITKTGWKDEQGEAFTDVSEAVDWLRREGACHASSSHFHPGLWYHTEGEQNWNTGENTTYNFHLDGFTPDEERMVYRAVTKRH